MIRGRTAHWRVAKVALELAKAAWEHLATKHDAFYKEHPNQKAWARMHQAEFLQDARTALSAALENGALSESDKEEIIEALALDQSLMPKTQPRQQITLN